jgi:hypothetical protein
MIIPYSAFANASSPNESTLIFFTAQSLSSATSLTESGGVSVVEPDVVVAGVGAVAVCAPGACGAGLCSQTASAPAVCGVVCATGAFASIFVLAGPKPLVDRADAPRDSAQLAIPISSNTAKTPKDIFIVRIWVPPFGRFAGVRRPQNQCIK